MNAIGTAHAAILTRLTKLFIRSLSEEVVRCQCPLRLDPYNEPKPDLAVFRPRSDDYFHSHPSADDVLLLIEVSDTSLAYDRTVKIPLYAKFGIPEVWIVDVAATTVEVSRDPKYEQYPPPSHRTTGFLSPSSISSIDIDINAIFVK